MAALNGMPDFTRVIWSSKADAWRQKIQEISQEWTKFELESVKLGLRQACIITISEWREYDLKDLEYRSLGLVNIGNTYSNNTGIVDVTKPTATRLLVGRNLPRLTDDDTIGRFLDYPSCCINFFNEKWNKEKKIDLVWDAIANSQEQDWQCNTILRYLGIRPVFHLPCSLDCQNTIDRANTYIKHFKYGGILKDILSWPLAWSTVNGIIEVKFPLGKIIACGDYYDNKRSYDYAGAIYPSEGETGLVYPYNYVGHYKSLNDYNTNGFTSKFDQDEAHEWLINRLSYFWRWNTFCDLGAGDGSLIKAIQTYFAHYHTIGHGVDLDHSSAVIERINIKDIKPREFKFPVALIAEQRFTDTYKDREEAINHIKTFAKNLIIYNYTTRYFECMSLSD